MLSVLHSGLPGSYAHILFKLDELLMGLRKLFEKASASKFLRDIYWALFDIRSKNMTDVLNCITLH